MAFPLAAIPIIGDIVKKAGDIIDQFVLDKDVAAAQKHELMKLAADHEAKLLSIAAQESAQQAEINKADAAGNWYQAGWRPSLGYVCVAGFAYNFVVYPVLTWYLAFKGINVTPPAPLSDMLVELTFGMLGLGVIRTWEKLRMTDRGLVK